MKERKGPYLAAALFCHSIKRDGPDHTTLARVSEIVFAPPRKEGQKEELRIGLFILFHGGSYTGKATIELRGTSPDGIATPGVPFPVSFGRADAHVIVAGLLHILEPQEGQYLYEVYLNDEFITQMPLKVIRKHPPLRKMSMN